MLKAKPIPGFNDRYLITKDGVIYDNEKKRTLIVTKGREYLQVKLYSAGVPRVYFVHRLVALTYLPNPKGLRVVNHIDGNKYNCNVDNLEWATHTENNYHASHTGLSNNTLRKDNTLGAIGIRTTPSGKYRGYLNYFKKTYYTGQHDDIQDAIKARKELKQNIVTANAVSDLYFDIKKMNKPIRFAQNIMNNTDDIGSKIDDARDAYDKLTNNQTDPNRQSLSIKKQATTRARKKVEKTKPYQYAKADINRRLVNGQAIVNQKWNNFTKKAQ